MAGQIIYYVSTSRVVPSYDFLKLYGTYQNLKIWYFGYHSSWRKKFAPGWSKLWAKFRPPLRILSQKAGRSRAIRADPMVERTLRARSGCTRASTCIKIVFEIGDIGTEPKVL